MDNLQGLPIDDFSGGMTDFIVGADPRQNEIIQNMVIDENRDLITRNGSRALFEYRITSTEVTQSIIPYSTEYLVQAEDKLYFLGVSSPTAINIVGGSDAFTGADTTTKVFQNFWNDNIIISRSDLKEPLRCWKNESSTFKLERLGLPSILLGYLITIANEIKADFNAHIADTGEHSSSGSNTVTSSDADDMDTLLTLTSELLTKYELHLDNTGIHPGSIDQTQRLEERVITTIYGAATTLSDLKAKYNAHDNDSTAHTIGGGSHQITSKATRDDLLSSSGGTGSSYLYALHYKYTYQTSDKTFIENSDVLYLELTDVGAPDSNNVTLYLPELTAIDEYNITSFKIAIYRTFDGGQDFYKLDEVDYDTSTYVDAKSDSDIENNAPLYTAGGTLSDEAPPKAKYTVIANDTLYLGHIKDGILELPNVLQASKPGRLYSCPSTFRLYFEESIKGLGFINTYPIVFLESKIYRVEGSIDSTGSGYLRKRLISDSIGVVSQKSIVNTKDGVYFASQDGFYFTDGFEYKKISIDLNHTYAALADYNDIEGTYNRLNNRVYWSAKNDSSNTYNDSIYVGHIDFITPKEGNSFTIFNGGDDPDNFSVTGISFDNTSSNNYLLRLDPNGYLIYHDSSFSDDCYVSTSKTPDNWDTQTIFYKIDSVAIDFGDSKVRKWVPKLNFNASNVSALSLQIQSANDNTSQYVNLKECIDQSNVSWGDSTVIWGDDEILWNLLPIISQWRYFPAINQKIRCMYKQLRFKNAYITIDNSDSLGNVSVNSSTSVASLSSYPTKEWASDIVNYYITFSHESYAYDYKIISYSGASLTISDPANTLTDSSDTEFKIRGYKKGELLNLSNYVISYTPITMTQSTEQGGS